MSLDNNTTMKQFELNMKLLEKEREVVENELYTYFVDEFLLSVSVFV